MAVSTSGNYWHDSNRGLSLYITIYLSLFALILLLSVSTYANIRVRELIPYNMDLRVLFFSRRILLLLLLLL